MAVVYDRSVAAFSGTSNAQFRARDHDEAQSIAAMIGDAAGCIIDASGVRPKAAVALERSRSRARDRAEFVTDDKAALREQLEAATGERIAALEAVEPEKAKGREAEMGAGRSSGDEDGATVSPERERTSGPETEQVRAQKSLDRDLGL